MLQRNVEQPVAELVPIEQHAPHFPAGEPRAEHGVGAFVDEHRDDAQQIARVVLEVGVVDDGNLAGGLGQRGPHRRALAAVLRVAQEAPP